MTTLSNAFILGPLDAVTEMTHREPSFPEPGILRGSCVSLVFIMCAHRDRYLGRKRRLRGQNCSLLGRRKSSASVATPALTLMYPFRDVGVSITYHIPQVFKEVFYSILSFKPAIA